VLTKDECHAILGSSARTFIELVATADLGTPVPSCPGWNLLDLARHVGSVHRWATECILTGAPAEEPEGPTEQSALMSWMEVGAHRLVTLLRASDPQAPTWNFGPPPRTVSFWSRRQAHETVLHLWDAHHAIGVDDDIAPALALDGVDEVCTMFFPRQVRLGRIPPVAHGIAVELEEAPGTRYVVAGDGTDASVGTVATIRGPAAYVLLALWGRRGIEHLKVDGDPDVVRAVLRSGIVP
jgi:uncharacterized protein (TIGR03083 family)